ncbi:MAG: RdgB/HAM1 family non-canonical purine NTP pyrophosphatase [Gammaproteobacteria bacterium]
MNEQVPAMPDGTLVVATGNAGKLHEITEVLGALGIAVVPFVPEGLAETGRSFVENALIKARHAALHTGRPALADDSGLEVDALQGAPGIYSARYAGEEASDGDNLARLLTELADVPDERRSARFHCLLAYLRHPEDPVPLIAHGVWEGRVLHAPCGTNGFGYDPVFYVPSRGCSAAELPPEVKNRLSHRGQALRQLHRMLGGFLKTDNDGQGPPSPPSVPFPPG